MNQDKISPFDPDVIEAALEGAARVYSCGCKACAETVRIIRSALDERGIDATNGRAFALGVRGACTIFNGVAQYVDSGDLENISLMIVEPLRRVGDITDEQIEEAGKKYRTELKKLAEARASAMSEGLRQTKEQFGRFPMTPGSARNN